VIHHNFEMTSQQFEALKAWPTPGKSSGYWQGEFASQAPLNTCYVVNHGRADGAEGTDGYLALPGANADQFYAEASPVWERPSKTYDLRNTKVSLYLKAITPIVVNEGYRPHLFIDDFEPADDSLCGWYITEPLKIGEDWTLNAIDLVNDESRWTRYSNRRPLDVVLSRVGFIGVMYFRDAVFKGVSARGILGIDELKFGMPLNA
jgi:hypothetical protein